MPGFTRSKTSRNRIQALLTGHAIPVERLAKDARLPPEVARRLCEDERTLPDIDAYVDICRACPQINPLALTAYDPPSPSLRAGDLIRGGQTPLQVTICGCGNLGHVFAGLLSARDDLRVRVCVSTPEKAAQLSRAMDARGGIAVRMRDGEFVGRPCLVTSDPAEAIPGARLILLCVPSFVEEAVLERIVPYLEPDALVGSVPAPGGFDWKARRVLRPKGKKAVVFGVGVIPWMCKVSRYGEAVTVLGKKLNNGVVAIPPNRTEEVADLMSHLLATPVTDIRTFLNITFVPGNQVLHPGIMYDMFHDWDGKPLPGPPLFYETVSEPAADLLQRMSDELLTVCGALQTRIPGLRLSAVLPLHLSIQYGYGADVLDPSTLRSTIATNRAYAGIRTPMRQVEGGCAPDFGSRFFHEDIPHGLVVVRGIADLVGVEVPTIDRVLLWAQRQMGREYLRDGRLDGRDIGETGAPQGFGIERAEDLVIDAI
jgi:hypothetical protein